MARLIPWLSMAAVLAAASPGARAAGTSPPPDPGELPHTVWPREMSPRTIVPPERVPAPPLRWTVIAERSARRDDGRGLVMVLVEEGLAGPLESQLSVLADDLEREGYAAAVVAVGGGTPEEVRAALADGRDDGLVGALIIGELPEAWYEIEDDYGEYGYAAFPCDLYYMDLDGDWIDADGNGIYDDVATGEGSPQADVWIGHLLVTTAMGDAVDLIGPYLERDHRFRTGDPRPDGSALLYVDDDWAYAGDYFAWEMTGAFAGLVTEWDQQTTCVADYQPRLTQSFDMISVFVHSSPDAHYFVRDGLYETMSWTAIPPDADALFYNLFACSNANFADYTYMAGQYVLGTERGLLAVGSTKTGSMWMADPFYGALGRYETFGDAFLSWWATLVPYDEGDISWFFGMTLIGDPSLRIDYPVLAVDPTEIAVEGADGAPVEVALLLANAGVQSFPWSVSWDVDWLDATPSSGEIEGDEGVVTVRLDPGDLAPGTHTTALRIDAPGAANAPLEVPVELVVPDVGGEPGGGCQGCASTGGARGPAVVAALAALALLARRRR